MLRYLGLCLFLMLGSTSLWAQAPIKITIALDRLTDSTEFLVPEMKVEIAALLHQEYDVSYVMIGMDEPDFDQTLANAYLDSDLLIVSGFNVGQVLSQRNEYSKPTILTIVLDAELQGLPLTPDETSGVNNLTYTQSLFSIERDLETLYELTPYEEVIVLVDGSNALDRSFDMMAFMQKVSPRNGIEYNLIPIRPGSDPLSQIPTSSEAVFVYPLNRTLSNEQLQSMYEGLSDRGQISFSLLSTPAMDLGGYAAYDTDANLGRIPRRVALNVLKILEGTPAAEIKVSMQSFTESLLLNMDAARRANKYPSWDVLAKAVLINVNEVAADEVGLSLEAVIAEGLENNLSLSIAQKQLRNSELDVQVARGNYLPQLDVSTSGVLIDEATVRSSFGARGYFSTTASANLSQLVLSEPALANVAIQKLLLESSQQSLRQNELDVVLDISNAYLNILQAQELVRLRNENVNVIRKNLEIARAKERVGYAGTSDVFRLESELALSNIDLNSALANMRQARFSLNNLLNRDIDDVFPLEDIEGGENVALKVMDVRAVNLIENPGDAAILADFFVEEAFLNLPEIKQIQASIAAQERSLLSQNRAFYLPQLVLAAQYNLPISTSGYPEGVMPIDAPNTYSAAISAQLPIFQGNIRRNQQEQTRVGILQLEDQEASLRNNLEFGIRSNLENVNVAFSRVDLSNDALDAARKSFEIAQDSYQQGLLNITSLLDAQNALLQTEINATTSVYTFMANYFALERSTGYYHFLATPAQRDAYFSRFLEFISNRQ